MTTLQMSASIVIDMEGVKTAVIDLIEKVYGVRVSVDALEQRYEGDYTQQDFQGFVDIREFVKFTPPKTD